MMQSGDIVVFLFRAIVPSIFRSKGQCWELVLLGEYYVSKIMQREVVEATGLLTIFNRNEDGMLSFDYHLPTDEDARYHLVVGECGATRSEIRRPHDCTKQDRRKQQRRQQQVLLSTVGQ